METDGTVDQSLGLYGSDIELDNGSAYASKSNSADVDGFLAEANDLLSKAKREAAAIREQAYKEAKDSADVKLASAKLNLEAKSAEFAKSLQDETKALKASLLSSMPQFNESLKSKLSSI